MSDEPRRKYRRVEDRQLSSLPLNDALGKILDSGQLVDVIFLVGPQGERREISAHKLVLSARSEVFGAMVEARWNNSLNHIENVARIEIGSEINSFAFEHLIKFIYKDDVESCLKMLKFEDLFDLCALAEMYGFVQLREGAALKIALDLVKDYKNCYLTLENELVDKDLKDVAFSVLKRNLWEALISEDLPIKWTAEIWENVLTDETQFKKANEYIHIEEIDLFENLCRWRDHDPSSREDGFQKLLKLIRFPLMGAATLLHEVRPTKAVSSDDLLDILGSITPTTRKSMAQLNTESRRKTVRWVTNSEELATTTLSFMESQTRHCITQHPVEIMLLPGDYSGVIEVKRNNLKLTGFGPYTILQGDQFLLKIISNHVTLDNVTLHSPMSILIFTGDDNVAKNIRSTCKNEMFGLVFTGEDNIFENFISQSLCATNSSELDLKSGMNGFEKFCRAQEVHLHTFPPRFVLMDGQRNKISTFNCTFVFNRPMAVIPRRYQTKFIISGADMEIENVNYAEASKIFEETSTPRLSSLVPSMGARLWAESDDLVVSRCCFSKLKVSAGVDNKFEKVLVVTTNTIECSSAGHTFTNCKFGKVIDDGVDTVKMECVTVPEWLQIVEANADVYNM